MTELRTDQDEVAIILTSCRRVRESIVRPGLECSTPDYMTSLSSLIRHSREAEQKYLLITKRLYFKEYSNLKLLVEMPV